MARVAVVGVGKMGLSHLSLLRAHPQVEVAAICDSSGFMLDVLTKYTGVHGESDYATMLERVPLDAVVIATPTRSHHQMVRAALEKGLHVFCEKPLTLSAAESEDLAQLARARGLITQVGYHNRFVAAFGEVKRLLDADAIGEVTHVLAEAYGPVVLRSKSGTWRSRRSEGGGCLYDYAAHPLDLLAWYLGAPESVSGTVLGKVFSTEIEDEVYATLHYPAGRTAQLSVNWSDESHRKMTTRITLWGTTGRITADRQECQVYLRDTAVVPEGYRTGWNVRYTTDLTPPVWFYVRGEEYSAELDHFVQAVVGDTATATGQDRCDFTAAGVTDRAIELMIADAAQPRLAPIVGVAQPRDRRVAVARARARQVRARASRWWGRRSRR